MPKMHDYQKLLRKRLYLCICLTLLLATSIGIIYAIDRYIQKQQQIECDLETHQDFDKMVSGICTELSRCKLPAVEMVEQLSNDSTFNFHNEEQVYVKLEQLLEQHKMLSGAIMGFEDWAYPQYTHHNGFGPLVRRASGIIDRLQIGEFRDFRAENEWYRRQLQEPVAEWSKPFMSDDGVMIATYTLPLFENGRYMGGFGIDIDLSQFADHIDSLRPYPSSIVVVVDSELNILIHPNRSYIGTTKLPEAMQRVGIDPGKHPMYHSHDRKSGVDYDYLGQHRMAFYYAPITETNWMVLLYCNTDEIYAEKNNIHSITVIIGMVLGFFIFGLLIINIYRYTRDYYRLKQY